MYLWTTQTKIGKISIAENSGKITNLYFTNDVKPERDYILRQTPLLQTAFQQLNAYLSGDLKNFSVPLNPQGTKFLQQVWKALQRICYGQTVSYRDIALKVGNSKAARAVGLANNRNPIPVFIPCHRVLGSDGSLVGYRGGVELKAQLLEIERIRL
ncbi:MAG: methylated-DNA--[protein]-cysteine S-methyltransferase [Deltaproteobacteria bacterium]|jgi:methylated-DNA-[protein]-cysteine S-methyltransferase|nr:methylated-DNA--[protein]-cysteine S-methyltransferase [Deltaproteobacteria bacterium]